MSHLPELPDFGARNVLKPGVDLKTVLHGRDGNALDVMDEVEPLLRPLPEIGEFMTKIHMWLLGQQKLPKNESWSSEEGLREIRGMWMKQLSDTAVGLPEVRRRLVRAEHDVWPRLEPILARNQGLAAWSAMCVTQSMFSPMFVLRVHEKRLAEAMVPAHCVDWNIHGEIGSIPFDDGSFVSCVGDECFIEARDRCRYAQEYLKKAKSVLYLGGGCDPTLWTHGYHIPEDQQVTICDSDDCSAPLFQLVGPEQFKRINYRQVKMADLLDDPYEFGKYDLIIASGLMSYYRTLLGSMLMDTAKLLKPEGKFVFDLQVKHLTYLYVSQVHDWPGGNMTLEESPEQAVESVRRLCKETDLVLEDCFFNPECPAGVCFAISLL